MLMRKLFLASWLLCIVPAALAEVTVVRGIAPNGAGMIIRLKTYADQISYLPEILARGEVGPGGAFELSSDLAGTTWAFLDLGLQQQEIFLQPGEIYELLVENNPGTVSNSYYDREPLVMEFVTDDRDRLNGRIGEINRLYNDYLLNRLPVTLPRDRKQLAVQFAADVKAIGEMGEIPYLAEYARYKTASLEYFLQARSKATLAAEYLLEKPVLYDHVEYMDFFNLFFEKHLLSNNRFIPYNMIFDLIDRNAGLGAVRDTLLRDPLLAGPELAELALLLSLKEFYYTRGFKRENVRALAGEIEQHGLTAGNRRIAANLLKRFTRLQPGTAAPAWTLQDRAGRPLSLYDLKGMPVYLSFLLPGHPVCETEMALMTDLYPDFKSKVAFITILADLPGTQEWSGTLDNCDWPVLLSGREIELLEAYDAGTFPYFVLIDSGGNILKCPAQAPSENAREMLEEF